MVLLVDNYDSFTYNVVQYFNILGASVHVIRNDAKHIPLNPHYLVISPGPSTPANAGISLSLIAKYQGQIPILGICLGHQCIGELFGGQVIRAAKPVHGKTSLIYHDGKGVFKNLKEPFVVARYHSLIVDRKTLPVCLEISAETAEGEIMGLRHRDLPIEGVQFHPESIATENGLLLLQNFLNRSSKEGL